MWGAIGLPSGEVGYIIIDGQTVYAKQTIDMLNIFTNVDIKLTKDITVLPDHNFKDYSHNEPSISFSFKYVSELEINNIIDKLDTKKRVSMVYLMFVETPYCFNKSDATKWSISRTNDDFQDNSIKKKEIKLF